MKKFKKSYYFLATTFVGITTTFALVGNYALNQNSQKNIKTTNLVFQITQNPNLEKIYQKSLSEEFLKSLKNIIFNLNLKISGIEHESNQQERNLEFFAKIQYYKKIINFLENNLNSITQNPSKYGFNQTFLKVLFQSDEYDKAEINWEDKAWNGIIFGATAETNYAEETQNAQKNVLNQTKIKNEITSTQFRVVLNKYFHDLLDSSEDIFANDNDLPKVKDDFNFANATINNKSVIVMGEPISENSTGQRYQGWEDYIINKIRKRLTAFDLKQNMEFNETKKDEAKKPTPDEQDSIALDPDGNIIDLDKEFEIRDIPDLQPLINPEWSHLSIDDFLEQYNQADEETKANALFFKNPINVRYQYQILSLKKENDKLIANVNLKDKIATNNSREYQSEISNIDEDDDANFKTWAIYLNNLIMENFFSKIQNSLNLDDANDIEKIDNLDDKNKKRLQHLIYALSKFIFTDNYLAKTNEIYDKNLSLYQNNLGSKTNLANQAAVEVFKYFTNYLKNSFIIENKNDNNVKITVLNLFADIVNSKINNILQNIEQNKNDYLEKLKSSNVNIPTIIETLKYVKKEINNLEILSNINSVNNINNLAKIFAKTQEINHLYQKLQPFDEELKKSEIVNASEIISLNQEIKQPVATNVYIFAVLGTIFAAFLIAIALLKSRIIQRLQKRSKKNEK
ncbi:MSC_0620 family F1-like ATPase-associated subunit [Candidatus Mycoplasma pogonae]